MTRERLEQQSLESLLEIARREGVDVPEDTPASDLIDLLLEAYEEDREERESLNNYPISMEEKKFALSQDSDMPPRQEEEFLLPERYNESKIVLLLRDPAWAFAYWDVKDVELRKFRLETSSNGLYLRVHELNTEVFNPAQSENFFDIPVSVNDSKWYINLPTQGTYYALQIIYMKGNEFYCFASSNVISVPRGNISDDWGIGDTFDPYDLLIALSGIESLGIASYEKRIPQRIISMLDAQYLR